MKRLAIVGAGGHGLVVADAAQMCGWEHIEFFDDAWPHKTSNGVWPVQGRLENLYEQVQGYDGVVVAIGTNTIRAQTQVKLRDIGAPIVTIVHPSAIISKYARVGTGCVVFAGAVVNASAVVGDGVILNTSCSVDHDCVLADYVHISPGAHIAGDVRIGLNSWVGIGASVRQGISIGRHAVIGAGAVVIANVVDGQCVVGVPAHPISQ